MSKIYKVTTYAVCDFEYIVEAETEEKAKEKLIEKGGFDITYDEVLVEKQDYENAECIE